MVGGGGGWRVRRVCDLPMAASIVCALSSQVTKSSKYWLTASSGTEIEAGATAMPPLTKIWMMYDSSSSGLRP